jgi:hypothetical protein
VDAAAEQGDEPDGGEGEYPEDRRLSEMTSPAIAAAFLDSFAQTACEGDPERPIGIIREGAAFCCDDNRRKIASFVLQTPGHCGS